jgi:DNA-binding transcriptional regulator YiaG
MTPEKVTPAQLAAIAQRLNLSTQALADYLGVPVHTLTKWQNGTRTPPAVARTGHSVTAGKRGGASQFTPIGS